MTPTPDDIAEYWRLVRDLRQLEDVERAIRMELIAVEETQLAAWQAVEDFKNAKFQGKAPQKGTE